MSMVCTSNDEVVEVVEEAVEVDVEDQSTTSCIFVANIPNRMDIPNIEKGLYSLFKNMGEIIFIKASIDRSGRPYSFIYFQYEIKFNQFIKGDFVMGRRILRIEKAKGSNALQATAQIPQPLFPCYLVNINIEKWTPSRLLKLFSFYGDIHLIEGPKKFGPSSLDTLAIIYYPSQEMAHQAAESINGSLMDNATVHSSTDVKKLTANEFYYNNDDNTVSQ